MVEGLMFEKYIRTMCNPEFRGEKVLNSKCKSNICEIFEE